jgi:galactonate dehydratase
MRITDVETFVLGSRRALVKVSTDRGIHGWGDPTLEGWVSATVAAVARMAEALVGQDPRRVTDLWLRMDRGAFYRGGPVLRSAVAGLDQALWDIKGRTLGAPIHELLGGPVRDRVRIYGPAGGREDRTGDLETCRRARDHGVTLVKAVPAGPWEYWDSADRCNDLLSHLWEIRGVLGPGVDLAIDLHGRMSPAQCLRLMPELAALGVCFIEEPVPPEQAHALARVVAAAPVPVAVGERLYSRHDVLPALEAGVSIIQPDLSHAGGITECLRIAALAESFGAVLAPHCPLGPVALAACLQLDVAISNFYVQEQGLNLHLGEGLDLDLLHDPSVLRADGGFLDRPMGPGLGIEVDEDRVRARACVATDDVDTATWSLADGGFAEW